MKGIWTGKAGSSDADDPAASDEHIVMTPDGTFRFRVIQRLPETERYDGEFLKSCREVHQLEEQKERPRTVCTVRHSGNTSGNTRWRPRSEPKKKSWQCAQRGCYRERQYPVGCDWSNCCKMCFNTDGVRHEDWCDEQTTDRSWNDWRRRELYSAGRSSTSTSSRERIE